MADLRVALRMLRTMPVSASFSAIQSLKDVQLSDRVYGEAEARYLSRSGLWAEGPIPLDRANWMRLVGYASGFGSVESIATCFAAGRSTLGAVNKPRQLGSVVRSSTTARPAERHLILLAPADLAERLSGLRVPGLPFR